MAEQYVSKTQLLGKLEEYREVTAWNTDKLDDGTILAVLTVVINIVNGLEAIHIVKYIAPTVDAVPVIRCRDCRHHYDDIPGLCCSFGPCAENIMSPDDFCSYGEREKKNVNENHA